MRYLYTEGIQLQDGNCNVHVNDVYSITSNMLQS